MPIFDLPLDELRTYRPPLTAQPDLADFWARTLEQAAQTPLEATHWRTKLAWAATYLAG